MTGSALLPQPVPAGHSGPARLLTAPPPRGAGPASAARPSRGCLRLRGDRARAEAYIRPGPSRAKARVLRADIGGGFRSETRRARGAGHGSRRVTTAGTRPGLSPRLRVQHLSPSQDAAAPRSQASHPHPPALQSPQGSRQSGCSERRSPSGPGRRFCFLSPSSLALQNGDQRSREVRPPAEQLGKGGRDPHLQPPDRQCLRQSGEWALVHLRSHPPPWVPRGRRLHLGLSRTEGGYPWGALEGGPDWRRAGRRPSGQESRRSPSPDRPARARSRAVLCLAGGRRGTMEGTWRASVETAQTHLGGALAGAGTPLVQRAGRCSRGTLGRAGGRQAGRTPHFHLDCDRPTDTKRLLFPCYWVRLRQRQLPLWGPRSFSGRRWGG